MFENIIISQTACRSLETAAAEKRLSHAIVIEGTDEANRAAAALCVAQAVVCSGNEPPCGECSDCRKAQLNCHPDIIILSKQEKKANYLIDDVRAVKTNAYIVPNEAGRKVYIFSEAQYLTVPCQNTLLKLVEEPPAHAVFIMTCPSASYLLETIRSRSQSFFLGEAKESSLQSDNPESVELACKMARLLCGGDEAAFMWETAAFEKDKNMFSQVLCGLEVCLRDAIVLKSGGKTVLSDVGTAKALSAQFTAAVLCSMLDAVSALTRQLKSNVNNNLAVTRFCSMLYGAKTN